MRDMEKKFYYISIGYCGRALRTNGNQKYGYGDKVVPVYCAENELVSVATAVGQGFLADSCTVFETEEDAHNRYALPYRVLWDCM